MKFSSNLAVYIKPTPPPQSLSPPPILLHHRRPPPSFSSLYPPKHTMSFTTQPKLSPLTLTQTSFVSVYPTGFITISTPVDCLSDLKLDLHSALLILHPSPTIHAIAMAKPTADQPLEQCIFHPTPPQQHLLPPPGIHNYRSLALCFTYAAPVNPEHRPQASHFPLVADASPAPTPPPKLPPVLSLVPPHPPSQAPFSPPNPQRIPPHLPCFPLPTICHSLNTQLRSGPRISTICHVQPSASVTVYPLLSCVLSVVSASPTHRSASPLRCLFSSPSSPSFSSAATPSTVNTLPLSSAFSAANRSKELYSTLADLYFVRASLIGLHPSHGPLWNII